MEYATRARTSSANSRIEADTADARAGNVAFRRVVNAFGAECSREWPRAADTCRLDGPVRGHC